MRKLKKYFFKYLYTDTKTGFWNSRTCIEAENKQQAYNIFYHTRPENQTNVRRITCNGI